VSVEATRVERDRSVKSFESAVERRPHMRNDGDTATLTSLGFVGMDRSLSHPLRDVPERLYADQEYLDE
jgi:hypothetical protein